MMGCFLVRMEELGFNFYEPENEGDDNSETEN